MELPAPQQRSSWLLSLVGRARSVTGTAEAKDALCVSIPSLERTGGTSENHSMTPSGTEKRKKEHSDKLQVVKRKTVAVVVVADLILVGALLFQLLTLDSSLHQFMAEKTSNVLGFLQFQYNERFEYASLGAALYVGNKTDDAICRALLQSDAGALTDLHAQLRYEQVVRSVEIIAVVDRNSITICSAGPASANGLVFDPDGLVSNFIALHALSKSEVRASVMLDRQYFERFVSPEFLNDHVDLPSWTQNAQTLTQVVLTPAYCGHATPQGFLIFGHALTPRQYGLFELVLANAKSAIGGIAARDSRTHSWQTALTYNNAGDEGAADLFPDLTGVIFSAEQLDAVLGSAADIAVTGEFSYESVPYAFSMKAVAPDVIGNRTDPSRGPHASAIYVYAEPVVLIGQTLRRAMSWQIPWIIVIITWSGFIIRVIFLKFLTPMQQLIESVRQKRMKELNDRIRQLKTNRSAIWQLIFKFAISELVLFGLLILNRNLLDSVAVDFSSARAEGKILSYVFSSNANSKLHYLTELAAQRTFVTAVANQSASGTNLSAVLVRHVAQLRADAITIIGLDGVVRASTYAPAVGLSFPEPRIARLYSQEAGNCRPFLSHTAWDPGTVNLSTPGLRVGPVNISVLTRLIVAPIRSVTFPNASKEAALGDPIGALVVVRFLNGGDSNWAVDALSPGYFGLHMWDLYNQAFRDVTSVLKEQDRMRWGLSIADDNPELLPSGLRCMVDRDQNVIVRDLTLAGALYTASIVPFRRTDEVLLSPMSSNAFLVRGLPQANWDRVQQRQVQIQIVNMVIVVITLVLKIFLTYRPVRKFLDRLEKAFMIASLSANQAAKREAAASALLMSSDDKKRRDDLVMAQTDR